ncbi:uncharacterized protein LOC8280922 [Ricinus communis]|uniref:uncharacterized protein LOC8280922 n=1 Tax=Ricinus communis TaxID=3988 RepID=UPI00201B0D54|nr:uncharacterized protein LOC8280922 [Ricinus communis]XP_048234908.1 uncharacterized protein LOC8280922 [Ricinus communis]
MNAGGSRPKSFSKPSSSASHRKSRWESSSTNNPTSDSKSNHQTKQPPSNSNPSPKPLTNNNNNTNNRTPATPSNSSLPPGSTLPFHDLAPPPPPVPPPPPPPTYGFHMLERRTIALADGSVRSYFALPTDYQDFPLRPPLRFPPLGPNPDFPGGPRFPPMSPQGLGFRDHNQNKRKFGGGGEFSRYGNNNNNTNGSYHPDQLMAGTSTSSSPFRRSFGDDFRAAKHMRFGDNDLNINNNKHPEVDHIKLNKAFLHFTKLINETEADRKRYLENGKQGRLMCLVCGRSSKDFPDTHALVMHTYNSDNADLRVDHLGLHKALCILMGWNYSKPPDNAKVYQLLPADVAATNQDDLVMWPPMVIIHNTVTGKGKDGRIEGLGNKAMDNKIRDLGFSGGKSKSLYGRDGHLGITLIKFSSDQFGLKEALQLAEHFEKENHGRKAWGCIQPLSLGKDDEKNPNLVKVERSGEKKRILYGYLGTAADLYKVDFETRKKLTIESQRDYKASK